MKRQLLIFINIGLTLSTGCKSPVADKNNFKADVVIYGGLQPESWLQFRSAKWDSR